MQKNTILFVFASLMLAHFSFAQKSDSIEKVTYISAAISATNNGMSLIPTFSLGKPAVLFNLSVGNGRFSFEPDMRFALEGKTWSFLFWTRHKMLKTVMKDLVKSLELVESLPLVPGMMIK